MDTPNYEWLMNKGFRILRQHKDRIEIKTTHEGSSRDKGWSFICPYSEHTWAEMLQGDKTLQDHNL